jgi:nucleoside-diphosphate-sugar epimerase
VHSAEIIGRRKLELSRLLDAICYAQSPMAPSWKGRRVLVTGGTGFIGSFIVEELLARGATVRVPLRAQNFRALSERRAEIEWLEGDLRDPAYCAELVDGVDYVFHLAASRRNVEYHQKRPSDVINDNVRMSLAILDALKEKEMSVPVMFFSTANIPPALDAIAIAQSEKIDGYVLGKALCCTLWLAASRQRKFPLLILRPVGVYGPRDTFNEDGNVIPALMVKTRDANDKLKVWGDGTQTRAFLYVEDLARAVFTLIDNDIQGIQYVTSEDVVTVKELSESIRDLVRPNLPIEYQTDKPVGARTIPVLDMHPLLKAMKWTPLKEGLEKTFRTWKGM